MAPTAPDNAATARPDGVPARAPARLAAWLGLALPAVLAALLAWHTVADLDIWLHDRVGRDILAGGAVPTRNGFSFTEPARPWTDHEWLFQVVVAAVGRGEPAARAPLWTALATAAALGLVFTLWRDARRPGDGPWPAPARGAAMAFPLTFALGLLWVRLECRPELFSLLALAVLAGLVDRARAEPAAPAGATARARWLALVSWRTAAGRAFWLVVAWAQWHGFWLLAPALWLLVALVEPLDRRLGAAAARDGRARPAWASTPLRAFGPAVAALVAGALTPNHVMGLAYPFRALAHVGGGGPDLRHLIAEMAPLLSLRNQLDLTTTVFLAAAVWAAAWLVATAGRVPLWRALLMAAGLAAAAASQRNLGLAAVAFALGHAGYDPRRRWAWAGLAPAGRLLGRASRAAPYAAVALAAVALAAWAPRIADNRFYLREGAPQRFGRGLAAAQFPFAAADRLRELRPDGGARVGNNVDAASTIVNRRAGLVLVDGRTEAYGPAAWEEYLRLRQGGDGATAILAGRGVEAVLVAHANPGSHRLLESVLASPAWRLEFADEAGALFLPATGDAGAAERNAPALREAAARYLASPGAGIAGADRALALASLLGRGGLADESRAVAGRGLSLHAGHPQLNHNRGNQLLADGDAAGAADAFRRALAANPGLVDARVNLGVALFRQGDHAGAAKAFRAAVGRDPGRFDAWANLGEACLKLGDREGARAAYAKALALRPGDAALRRRAEGAGR